MALPREKMPNPPASESPDSPADGQSSQAQLNSVPSPQELEGSSPAGPSSQGFAGSPSAEVQRPLTPPPYSGPSTSHHEPQTSRQNTAKGPQKYPGLPRLDYTLYSPPLFELSEDSTTLRSSTPYLSDTPRALVSLMRSQATVPPKCTIRVRGSRGTGNRHVDFDLRMNLMPLLVPDDPRQRIDYLRCVGDGELAFRGGLKKSLEPDMGPDGGLEEWCRRYVEDQSTVKSFCLERVVANLDTAWLEGQLRSLVAAMGYKGLVTVEFPVTHARVLVQSPDRVNKFFTSVTTLFSGKKRYEVVKAVWPFATARNGEEGRRCLVQSEDTWFREWRDAIRYAVATKRQGWVTIEDKLECLMEGKGKGVAVDWGIVS